MNAGQVSVFLFYFLGAILNASLLLTIYVAKLVRHPVVPAFLVVLTLRCLVATLPLAHISELQQFLNPSALSADQNGVAFPIERRYLVDFCRGQGAVDRFFVTLLYAFATSFPLPMLGVTLASRSQPEPNENWEYVPKRWYEFRPLTLIIAPIMWGLPVLLVRSIIVSPQPTSIDQHMASPVLFLDIACWTTDRTANLITFTFTGLAIVASVILSSAMAICLIQLHREHHIAYNQPGLDKASLARWISTVIIYSISLGRGLWTLGDSGINTPLNRFAWDAAIPFLLFTVLATQRDVLNVWNRWIHQLVGLEPPQVQMIDSARSRVRWDTPWNTSFTPEIRETALQRFFRRLPWLRKVPIRQPGDISIGLSQFSPQPSVEEDMFTPSPVHQLPRVYGGIISSAPLEMLPPPSPTRQSWRRRVISHPSALSSPIHPIIHESSPNNPLPAAPLAVYTSFPGHEHTAQEVAPPAGPIAALPHADPRDKTIDPLATVLFTQVRQIDNSAPLQGPSRSSVHGSPPLPHSGLPIITVESRRPSLPDKMPSHPHSLPTTTSNARRHSELISIPHGLVLPPFTLTTPPSHAPPSAPHTLGPPIPEGPSPLRRLSGDSESIPRLSFVDGPPLRGGAEGTSFELSSSLNDSGRFVYDIR